MPGTVHKVEDPCQECKDRHLKCDDTRPRCRQCERLGEKCRRGIGKLKFRHGSSARYDATFAKDQTWLEQSKNAKIRFVDQRPEVENSYASDEAELSSSRSDHNQEAGLRTERHKSPLTADKSFISQREPPPHSHRLSTSTATNENVSGRPQAKRRRTTDSTTPTFPSTSEARPASVYDPIRFSYRVYDSGGAFHPADFHGLPDVTEQHHVPKVVEAEYRRLADSAAATIPPEVLLSPAIWKEQFYWPNKFTTTQCACLMRYYIEHLAPWFDVGDPARHFTLVVPQRARRCPPLLNAIFTAAARHLASIPRYKTADGVVRYENVLLPRLTEGTALQYHNACIAYLIKLSADPEHVRDENLLAAAVILRYYEELDISLTGEDRETFLHTFQIFVNAHAYPYFGPLTEAETLDFPRLASTDSARQNALAYLKGFQHASSRIALRQETTMAFMKQRAIHLPLETWSALQGFDEAEDFIWADRHLHHCANVLQFCFGSDKGAGKTRVERWNELTSFEIQWERNKPLSFSPIHYQEPDRAMGESFPHIWYMAEVHVSGLLYLELAKILLVVYNPSIPRLGPGAAAAQRRISEEVHDIVIRLCGIATSNPSSQPALVQAFMAIAVCGEHFIDGAEQEALLEILSNLEKNHGWPTSRTAIELKRGWGWDRL